MRLRQLAAQTAVIVAVMHPMIAGAASAVRLSNIQGRVLVDKGQGPAPVGDGVGLAPGDRVVVAQGSSADLFYGPDCQIVLKAGAGFTVTETSPCADPGAGGGFGGGVWLGAGAAALGIGVGIAVLADEDDDNDNGRTPLSP